MATCNCLYLKNIFLAETVMKQKEHD
jgi:hypothetical protein